MAIVISGVNNNDKITATDGLIDLLSTVSFASTVTAPAFTASGNITAASINVGNNIQLGNAGVVTATTFVGNLTGNVNNTGNLLLQIGGSEKFRIGGSGQLGIGGANYGTSGQVLTSGGSGSAATWSTVTGTTINNNADNRLITGSGSANTLEGEVNLTWNGQTLEAYNLSGPSYIAAKSNTNSGDYGIVQVQSGSTVRGRLVSDAAVDAFRLDSAGRASAPITFHTGSSYTERLRITSGGVVGINTDASGNGSGGKLVVGGRIQSNAGGYWIADSNGAENGWHIQDSSGDLMIVESGVAERLRIHNSGTLQAFNHATSRNGIVQVQQVTSETRYAGSPASVDLITGSTFTPKTSAPRFLIMIFCPVNTSDDSDAGNGNANFYNYGRIEYRKSGGGWIECNNQGSTAQQGGYASHISLSPNRTGNNTTDYWSGNRYRMAHKTATILVTNVGDCGLNGTVQFKLRCYSYTGNFIQIGQPHGYGNDNGYGVQPWGFTVFELAPDSNSYTAY